MCWESQCFFPRNFVTFSWKIFGIFFHNINVTNFSNIEGGNAKLSIAQNWGGEKNCGTHDIKIKWKNNLSLQMFIMYLVLNIIIILFYFMFWRYYRVIYQPYFFSCWNYWGHFMQIEGGKIHFGGLFSFPISFSRTLFGLETKYIRSWNCFKSLKFKLMFPLLSIPIF